MRLKIISRKIDGWGDLRNNPGQVVIYVLIKNNYSQGEIKFKVLC